jgi:hypothetical protein
MKRYIIIGALLALGSVTALAAAAADDKLGKTRDEIGDTDAPFIWPDFAKNEYWTIYHGFAVHYNEHWVVDAVQFFSTGKHLIDDADLARFISSNGIKDWFFGLARWSDHDFDGICRLGHGHFLEIRWCSGIDEIRHEHNDIVEYVIIWTPEALAELRDNFARGSDLTPDERAKHKDDFLYPWLRRH